MIPFKDVKTFWDYIYFRSEQLYDSNLLAVNCGILAEFSKLEIYMQNKAYMVLYKMQI